MSDATDIRDWAAKEGIDVGERGRIAQSVREQYYRDNPDKVVTAVPEGSEVDDGPLTELLAEPLTTKGETAPKAQIKRPRKPLSRRRASLDRIGAGVWSLAANLLGGQHHPIGRVLSIQAPVAGAVLDDVVAGTVVDRVLQPFAKASAKGEVAYALLGPPVLVAVMTQQPQLAPILRPMLADSMMAWLDLAGPKAVAMQERREKIAKRLGIEGADVEAMIELIFAPPVPENAAAA